MIYFIVPFFFVCGGGEEYAHGVFWTSTPARQAPPPFSGSCYFMAYIYFFRINFLPFQINDYTNLKMISNMLFYNVLVGFLQYNP